MTRSRSLAVLVFLLLLADVAAAQSADAPAESAGTRQPVGGVVLGDPHSRLSHFSANAQGYSYPSYLVPCSWAGGGGCAAPQPGRSGSVAAPGYRGKRSYDALRYRRDRSYARDRFYDNRRYARERYYDDRSYARDRYFRNRRYANERY